MKLHTKIATWLRSLKGTAAKAELGEGKAERSAPLPLAPMGKYKLSKRWAIALASVLALLGVGGITYAANPPGVIAVTTNFTPSVIPKTAPFNVSTLNVTMVNNDVNTVINNLNMTVHITPNSGLEFDVVNATFSGAGCTGTPTASLTATGDVLISNGGVTANSQLCVVSIQVKSITPGTYTSQLIEGEPMADGVTVPATSQAGTLTVQPTNLSGPTAGKAFNPANIDWWQTSVMTLRIHNPNGYPMTNASLQDSLPANMLVDSLVSNGCSGSTLSGVTSGSSSVGITGANIAAGSYCDVNVRVKSDLNAAPATGQTLTNTIVAGGTCGTLNINGITEQKCSTSDVSAALNILTKPIQGLSKSFSPTSISSGSGVTTMSIQLFNNTVVDWTDVVIPDVFPSGMYLASTTTGGSCTGSSASLTAGTVGSDTPDTAVAIALPSLPSGQWCTVTLQVKGKVAATTTLNNSIPADVITQNGVLINNQSVGADLQVTKPPPCSNCTVAAGLAGVQTKTFTNGLPAHALGYPNPQPYPGTLPGKFIIAKISPAVVSRGMEETLLVSVDDSWVMESPYYHIASGADAASIGVQPTGGASAIWGTCTGWTVASGGQAGDQSFKVTGITFNIPAAPTNAPVTRACDLYVLLKVDANIPGIPPEGVNQTNMAKVSLGGDDVFTNVATSTIYNLPPIYPVKWFASVDSGNYFSSADSPSHFFGGHTILARVYIRNDAPVARTGIAFSDLLPISSNGVQMTLAPGATASDIAMHCHQNASATAMPNISVSGNTVSVSGLDLPAASYNAAGTLTGFSICTFDIPVQVPAATQPGESFTNIIGAGEVTVASDSQANSVIVAQDTITIADTPLAPNVGKEFSEAIIFQDRNGVIDPPVGGIPEVSKLTFRIKNPNALAANAYTDVSFTDTFPTVGGQPAIVIAPNPNVTYSGCSGAAVAVATAGAGSVSFSGITVPNGATCLITVNVIGKRAGNHTNTLPVGSVTAVIANGPTVTSDAAASASISVLNSYPAHSLTKDVAKASAPNTSIDTNEVLVGDVLRYTVVLKNVGAVQLNLSEIETITDKLPEYLSFTSASNGGALVGDTVTWDLTGSSTVLPVGASYTVTWDATVLAPTAAAAQYLVVNDAKTPAYSSCPVRLGSACINKQPTASCTAPADPLNITAVEMSNPNVCKPVVNPLIAAEYEIIKDVFKTSNLTESINNQAVVPTDALSYIITVTNTGATPILASRDLVSVTDQLPAEVTYVAGSASPAITPDPTTNAIAWDLSASTMTIPVGGNAKFRVDVTVNMGAVGPLLNTAKVKGVDTNTTKNPITPATFTVIKDVFAASNPATSIDTQNVNLGDELLYVIKVKNPGPAPVSMKNHVQSITDTIPTGTTYVAGSATPTASSIPGAAVGWDFANSTDVIAAGEERAFSFKVTVDNDATGTISNTAKVGTKDTNTTTNPVTPPKYSLLKDVRKKGSTESHNGGDVIGGDELTYAISIKNIGTGNLSLKDFVTKITDDVPVGTTVTSVANGGVQNGNSILWDLSNSTQVLPAGQSTEFTFDVIVDESAVLPIANVAKTKDVSSCPITDSACIATPPVAACTMPADVLALTAAEQADVNVCKPVVNKLILDTTLYLEKTVDRKEAELGDMVKYTIRVKNSGKARATAVKVTDILPAGFRYIDDTTRMADGTVMPEPEGAPGPTLVFALGNISAGAEVTFTYRARIGVGAMQGDGINRATACTTANKILCSNEGRAKVRVDGGVFTDKACLMGTAFADLNDNAVKDENETGVPGVKLYMEDGTYFITDTTGKYSHCGIEPRTHVLKVDKASLPRGSALQITSNRNMGDANSLFLDVKNGELIRGDVAIKPTSEQFMKDVLQRIKGQADEPAKGVSFEGIAQ